MKNLLKSIGNTRFRSPMTIAALMLVLAFVAGTVFIGAKLYDITGSPQQFSTQ